MPQGAVLALGLVLGLLLGSQGSLVDDLLLQPRPPLLLQLLLDLVDLLCQEVVVLILREDRWRSVSACVCVCVTQRERERERETEREGERENTPLPCCWLTRTCPPPPSGRRPPGSPSSCPSELQGPGWGRWPGLYTQEGGRVYEKGMRVRRGRKIEKRSITQSTNPRVCVCV